MSETMPQEYFEQTPLMLPPAPFPHHFPVSPNYHPQHQTAPNLYQHYPHVENSYHQQILPPSHQSAPTSFLHHQASYPHCLQPQQQQQQQYQSLCQPPNLLTIPILPQQHHHLCCAHLSASPPLPVVPSLPSPPPVFHYYHQHHHHQPQQQQRLSEKQMAKQQKQGFAEAKTKPKNQKYKQKPMPQLMRIEPLPTESKVDGFLKKKATPRGKIVMCASGLNCEKRQCVFAHTLEELVPQLVDRSFKTQQCSNVRCTYGNFCKYLHQDERVEYRGNEIDDDCHRCGVVWKNDQILTRFCYMDRKMIGGEEVCKKCFQPPQK